MRRFPLPAILALFGLLALCPSTEVAHAAPAGVPERRLDLELKAAPVTDVLRVLADASRRAIVLDPCVRGTVDLKLKNVPLPLVYDALALKLGLVYDDEGGAIRVRCAGAAPEAPPAANVARVSLDERESALPDVLERLVASAKLGGVDYRAAARPTLSMRLDRVRVSTALTALADATGLQITLAGGRVVVADR